MESSYIFRKTPVLYSDIGKGTAIVLLHGFLENKEMWSSIALQLSEKYRVITIDLLGHGKSENLGYIHTMEDQATMVKAVLDHIGVRRYICVGHSMGGYIALAFAKKYKSNIRGLSLMNSTALADSTEKKINRDRAVEAVKQNHKTFVRLAIPTLFSEENRSKFPKEITQITQEALQMSPRAIVAALEGMKIRPDLTSLYKVAKFPIQLIAGKKDGALDYESLVSQVQNTTVSLVTFPDGHMSHIENPEALMTVLTDFIKSSLKRIT